MTRPDEREGTGDMHSRVLVVYHSVEGQAEKIACRIADDLQDRSIEVNVCVADAAPSPVGYHGVVVGDSIHAVHHSKALTCAICATTPTS